MGWVGENSDKHQRTDHCAFDFGFSAAAAEQRDTNRCNMKTWQEFDDEEAFGTIVNNEAAKQYIAIHFPPELCGSLFANRAL